MWPSLTGCLILTLSLAVDASAQGSRTPHLNIESIASIGVGAVGIGALGHIVSHRPGADSPRWSSPLPGEHRLIGLIGGACYAGKTNFLDNSFGSSITPIVGVSILTFSNLTWPQGKAGKDAAEDLYLYGSGLVATKGLTDIAKGLFSRTRPLPCLEPGLAKQRDHIDLRYDNQSFMSGHTTSAFFSTAFLNKRLRSIMRQRMSPSGYQEWRWAPPALLFGWATFVGWSRIHAYKHFPSDVIAGAVAGWLMAELFYSFSDREQTNVNPGMPSPISIRISLPI